MRRFSQHLYLFPIIFPLPTFHGKNNWYISRPASCNTHPSQPPVFANNHCLYEYISAHTPAADPDNDSGYIQKSLFYRSLLSSDFVEIVTSHSAVISCSNTFRVTSYFSSKGL